MEPTPGEAEESCVSEASRFALPVTGGMASAVRAGEGTEPAAWSMATAEPGSSGALGRTLQQSPHCIITGALQSRIDVPWQEEECADGIRHTKAGVAAQRTTSASNTKTPFLPTCIVYAIHPDHSGYHAPTRAVT